MVLVLNGEFDNFMAGSAGMSRGIERAVHRAIPETCHACCLEDSGTCHEVVMEFPGKKKLY